ncbi:MAG: glutathione S-transferase family protein, partial [Pseudomonadota bacterium]
PNFLAMASAGQVPVLRLPDGTVIDQSNAITSYIAEQTGSDLIPVDPVKKAQMLAWMFWEQYSHETAIAVRRFRKLYLGLPDDEIDPALLTKGYAALDRMESQLSSQDWIVADQPTLADVALVAYTRVAHEGGFDLKEYPNVRGWIARVETHLDIPHITEHA